ncbi:MAG: STAS domain-containing protein [bacterium]
MSEYEGKIDLEIESRGEFLIITPVVVDITFKNARFVLKTVKDAVENNKRKVIMNMKHVEIIDSVSLGTLVAILKYVRSLGGDMVIANASMQIKELFFLLNFQSVFRLFDCAEDAEANF